MRNADGSWRGWVLGMVLGLSVATLALAQVGGGAAPEPIKVMEYTQQDVQPALLVQTLNEMGKQQWDVFQIVPAWTVNNDNGAAELVAKSYQVFGRRPTAPAK